eukprot:g12973.t1
MRLTVPTACLAAVSFPSQYALGKDDAAIRKAASTSAAAAERARAFLRALQAEERQRSEDIYVRAADLSATLEAWEELRRGKEAVASSSNNSYANRVSFLATSAKGEDVKAATPVAPGASSPRASVPAPPRPAEKHTPAPSEEKKAVDAGAKIKAAPSSPETTAAATKATTERREADAAPVRQSSATATTSSTKDVSVRSNGSSNVAIASQKKKKKTAEPKALLQLEQQQSPAPAVFHPAARNENPPIVAMHLRDPFADDDQVQAAPSKAASAASSSAGSRPTKGGNDLAQMGAQLLDERDEASKPMSTILLLQKDSHLKTATATRATNSDEKNQEEPDLGEMLGLTSFLQEQASTSSNKVEGGWNFEILSSTAQEHGEVARAAARILGNAAGKLRLAWLQKLAARPELASQVLKKVRSCDSCDSSEFAAAVSEVEEQLLREESSLPKENGGHLSTVAGVALKQIAGLRTALRAQEEGELRAVAAKEGKKCVTQEVFTVLQTVANMLRLG